MPDFIETIKKVSVFQNLADDLIPELDSKLERQSLAAGTVLFREGDQGDCLYIINHGHVQISTRSAQGKEVILNQFGPGDSLGELSLLDRQPRSATAMAITPVELFKFDRDDFMALIARDPAFALSLMQDLSSKLRFTVTLIQLATEWNQYIARGDYTRALSEMQRVETSHEVAPSEAARVRAFLTSFFQLVEGVREREETLKREVRQLRIEIDEAKKVAKVAAITETDYFQRLKERAQTMRQGLHRGLDDQEYPSHLSRPK
ncbi:MAG: cyclic nucleotide-binding domain-containing protein [Chloroflexota bacterium]|nr:cyclic nucleotide-binding domain-containing protein [Chloroflexota bacterium]